MMSKVVNILVSVHTRTLFSVELVAILLPKRDFSMDSLKA